MWLVSQVCNINEVNIQCYDNNGSSSDKVV